MSARSQGDRLGHCMIKPPGPELRKYASCHGKPGRDARRVVVFMVTHHSCGAVLSASGRSETMVTTWPWGCGVVRSRRAGVIVGVGHMRLTDFWGRLDQVFGPSYAASVASDQVLTTLRGRTIEQAFAAGEEVVTVWRAVVAAYPDRVPVRLR
jgi:hypothetical protein